ncbi:translocation/assembly module TamB domain-containing protein [Massilia sp. CF038]|uniref:translocation/assembly module TamB domain-containing protein n=1 Tax=Massilia sp. CF038 TaxID=1881045 RepID=UPI00091E69A5|nr:translocation/assembly module TamB domain-containing protein [Massilia sp. CF038]SHH63928.1 translocation and assembly module TamB [Massilia sp. CF038]
MTETATDTPPLKTRRWPRRLAIGVAVTGAVLAGAYWYGGRESTLQALVQRVANASGGSIVVTGVKGSLYSSMSMDKIVYRSPEQLITIEHAEVDWSPFQYFTRGVAINRLHVMSLRVDTLREGEKAKMPTSLAAPFSLTLNDARINKVTLANAGATTVIADVRFDMAGDKTRWMLRNASAVTPWGYARADGSIGAAHPFKLEAKASLTQLAVPKGQKAAQLNLRAGGDLLSTQINADGQSGKAVGDAAFTLAPFDPVPLRAMAINGKKLDPTFLNPTLPKADLSVKVTASIDAKRNVKGSVDIANQGPVGTIDKQLLPLRAMRGELTGTLDALRIGGAVIDFGNAGKFAGSGAVDRNASDAGLGSASFVLHTDRLDLRQIHSSINRTAIAGDIKLASSGKTQTLSAHLVEAKMRLDAEASLADNLLQIKQASLRAGGSLVRVVGNASMVDKREFKASASASKFNPAAFGDYPAADINADINVNGFLAPAWKIAADFALRPSRLFELPLSGKGKLNADATHISNVDATLALGGNSAELRGSFGAPGEKLQWRADGKQLGALRKDLMGSVVASGVVTGTMQMPRTSFELDAKGLGWTAAARTANAGVLHASGNAWLNAPDKAGQRVAEVDLKGMARAFNPAAFGDLTTGSINAGFDGGGRLGADWRGALNLTLEPSTLANAPLWGYAKLKADAAHVSNADVDLHLGPNILAAKGSFGSTADVLDWRIDAPQLASLGPNFGGVLRGAGKLSGSMAAPSLSAALDGQNLKLFAQHQIKTIKASANVGSGRGAADPLVGSVELTGYTNGSTVIESARLQSEGTRGAHILRVAARGDTIDASGEVRGGFDAGTWNGTVASLQNKGRYAFALQAPTPLRIAGAPGEGVTGLLSPEVIALRDAIIKLPNGSVSVQTLDKNGAHWTSKGVAEGVPITYLGQFSPALRDNAGGDLSLGAQWALDMQAGPNPALRGMLHVFREKGDLIVGAEVPVVLGLRTLDLRADIADGALRTQLTLDATRAGQATVDATTQLVDGRLSTASPLKLTANADMTSIAWLAPLFGQPGLELDGSLKLALTGAGTVGAPTLNGNMNGDALGVRWPEQGVKLRNGQLRAQLSGDQLILQRLDFDGTQGHIGADGNVRFAGGEASMQLKLVADKIEILSRPDRTLVISGQSTLVRDAKRFELDGKFRADRALIELAPQDRPTLSDDVIVLGRTKPGTVAKTESKSLPLSVDIEADLGDAFRLRGMGIDAELAGTVRVRSSSRGLRANGGIRVVAGTYKAYGQNLTIERGVLTFSGPYDNPALNILAVRKRPEGEQLSETNVEAGVEVRGTALAPVAKLVSTPNVTDSEKLAWLVLGHGMEAVSGNETGVLAAAAGALLGGNGSGGFQSRLANSLGVDELGLSQAKGLESTVVTVGKRLSSRAYLSFEQGATTASSLVKLRYKLNNKFTLQIQAGTNTALDILYTWAFD